MPELVEIQYKIPLISEKMFKSRNGRKHTIKEYSKLLLDKLQSTIWMNEGIGFNSPIYREITDTYYDVDNYYFSEIDASIRIRHFMGDCFLDIKLPKRIKITSLNRFKFSQALPMMSKNLNLNLSLGELLKDIWAIYLISDIRKWCSGHSIIDKILQSRPQIITKIKRISLTCLNRSLNNFVLNIDETSYLPAQSRKLIGKRYEIEIVVNFEEGAANLSNIENLVESLRHYLGSDQPIGNKYQIGLHLLNS